MTDVAQQDVVALLLEQHNQIKTLFNQVSTARGTQKRELFEDLVRLLAVHESAEEEVVHPAARRSINGGDQVVESLQAVPANAWSHLAAAFDQHYGLQFGDGGYLDAGDSSGRYLRENLPADRLSRMAGALKAAEATAPTRPHPGAGESAMANLLVGPPAAVFDRTRDAVRDWRQSQRDED